MFELSTLIIPVVVLVIVIAALIALMLITLYISKRRIQQLEETKPSLGIRELPPSSPGMTISSITLYKNELT